MALTSFISWTKTQLQIYTYLFEVVSFYKHVIKRPTCVPVSLSLSEGTQDGIQVLPGVQQLRGLRRRVQEVSGARRPHGDAARPQGAGGPGRLREVLLPPGQLARVARHQRPAGRRHVPVRRRDAGLLLPVAQALPVQSAGWRETGELRGHVVGRRRLVGPLLWPDHELRVRVRRQGGALKWTGCVLLFNVRMRLCEMLLLNVNVVLLVRRRWRECESVSRDSKYLFEDLPRRENMKSTDWPLEDTNQCVFNLTGWGRADTGRDCAGGLMEIDVELHPPPPPPEEMTSIYKIRGCDVHKRLNVNV